MYLEPNYKYKIKLELNEFLQDQLVCENYLSSTLDLSGFIKCKVISKTIEIIFNPSIEINEELILREIDLLLQQIGIVFIKAIIKQFSINLGRTLIAAATGSALGSRAGPIGIVLGGAIAAYLERELLSWKDICYCKRDEFGNLTFNDLRGKK